MRARINKALSQQVLSAHRHNRSRHLVKQTLPSIVIVIILQLHCSPNNSVGRSIEAQETETIVHNGAFKDKRYAMVAKQLETRGLNDRKVLDAMRVVPRHLFIPTENAQHAYADTPLPIGYGQTISQPYIVGLMTTVLEPKPTDRILEIGTGSGYQAAVLSQLVTTVYTIEIVEPLAQRAAATLAKLDYRNVQVKAGDGYLGWEEHAPYDGIIVTCAPEAVPKPLLKQLKPGGRLVIPVGPTGGAQTLYFMRKTREGKLETEAVLPVRFVPMTGPHTQVREP